MTYTRNDLWRIARAARHLEKSLDGIARGMGELRPKQFTPLRSELGVIQHSAEVLLEQMTELTTKPPVNGGLDLDLDDAQA